MDYENTVPGRRKTELKIFRCERCKKPCMLTTLDNITMKFCPVDSRPVFWKQLNQEKEIPCPT